MKHADIITKLTLEQKCALLSGETVFTTRGYKNAGIPSITLSDGPNGVRKQAGAADHLGLNPSVPATCFPTAATVACSWDPALGEQLGRAMGEEAAAQEVSVLLGPGLNTKRSPLCGRNFEYFSEDPYLSGKLAAAYVRGIQSNGIAACPKHFAVNSQELRRMASDSVVDERTLRELYLTGFEIVVKEAHPKTIMSSYNLVNGTYANENAHLLQDILRRDWGFDGAVVTDWGGSNDHALGVKNGSTLEMPAPGGDAIRELMKAVQTGKITEADVDARLEELLELVFTTKAAVDAAPGKFDADAHHALARRAAAQSIVLLKNENSLLPLAKGEKVAVIGDFAKTPRYQGAGSSAVNSIQVDSFLDCLAESGLNSVGYAQGFDRQGKADQALQDEAVLLAKNATVTVCHTKTVDVAGIARKADILVSAAGVLNSLTKDYVSEGQIVIDVSINWDPEKINSKGGKGAIAGDAVFSEVEPIVGAITPVPGGVGPMTRAMLMRNILTAARNHQAEK